jgi:putative tricarboxylic transport membrane protein
MKSLNRDTAVAVVLLAFTGLFYWESYNIPQFEYASIGSEVWPRVILIPLFLLSLLYLFQSFKNKKQASGSSAGIIGLVSTYRNPILSFVIFFVFLLTIDYLGMLIGGSLLVFALLTTLGHKTPKFLLLHAVIAIVSVGAVWSLFTFALRVYLPEGELLHLY